MLQSRARSGTSNDPQRMVHSQSVERFAWKPQVIRYTPGDWERHLINPAKVAASMRRRWPRDALRHETRTALVRVGLSVVEAKGRYVPVVGKSRRDGIASFVVNFYLDYCFFPVDGCT